MSTEQADQDLVTEVLRLQENGQAEFVRVSCLYHTPEGGTEELAGAFLDPRMARTESYGLLSTKIRDLPALMFQNGVVCVIKEVEVLPMFNENFPKRNKVIRQRALAKMREVLTEEESFALGIK